MKYIIPVFDEIFDQAASLPWCEASQRQGPYHICEYRPARPESIFLPWTSSSKSRRCPRRRNQARMGRKEPYNTEFRNWLESAFGWPVTPEKKRTDRDEAKVKSVRKDPSWTKRMDFSGVDPEDVTVTVTDQNRIKIEANKEMKEDGVYGVERMVNEFSVPEEVNLESLKVLYEDNGRMTLKAEKHDPKGPEAMDCKEMEQIEHEVTDASTKDKLPIGEVDIPSKASSGKSQAEPKKKDVNTANDVTEKSLYRSKKSDPEDEDCVMTCFEVAEKEAKTKDSNYQLAEVTPSEKCQLDEPEKSQLEESVDKAVTVREDFKLTYDLEDYPEDCVDVKVADGMLTVMAEFEEENDGVFSQRRHVQRRTLPDYIDVHTVTSSRDSDGKLTITAKARQ